MAKRKLNLGCGRKTKEGGVNLDIVSLPGVDVVHGIKKLPLPFGDAEFDVICCDNILEHIEYIYESTFLCRLIPANDIITELIK